MHDFTSDLRSANSVGWHENVTNWQSKKDVLLLLLGIYWGKLALVSLDFSLGGSKLAEKQEEITRNYQNSNLVVKNKRNISVNLL